MLAAAAAAGQVAHAQNAGKVRGMVATCANCHGTDGRSVGRVPGLAGLDKVYFAQRMKDYKTGKRPGTIMPQLAKGYTDEQIEQLAAHYSALKK